jgi:GNAT superfamily N-acetyltransferase
MEVITPLPHHVFAWSDLVTEFLKDGIDQYDWGVNESDLHTTYHLWNKDFGWLLEHEGEIVGVLAGQVAPHFFNYENLFFHEMMWFVKPEFRHLGGGIMLYRACVKRCKERGIKRIVFGHTKHLHDEIKKTVERLGFTYLETHYEKVI